MSQNIYDRDDFFKAYSEIIDRSNEPVDDDLVWKRLRPLLPASIDGMNILDAGCGSGWFARWAADHGAESVLATDISNNMLDKARKLSSDKPDHQAKIEYRVVDMDVLPLQFSDKAPYDLVVSLLAFHYLKNLKDVIEQIVASMKPGALFVVNVEHPMYTAPQKPRVVEDKETGEKSWNLADYYKEGERVIDWLAPGLQKYHRTMTGYLDIFLGSGLQLVKLAEFLPTKEEVAAGKVDKIEEMRPLFLMMSFQKRP